MVDMHYCDNVADMTENFRPRVRGKKDLGTLGKRKVAHENIRRDVGSAQWV